MYDYDYMTGQTAKAAANVAGTLVWTIIAIVIAIAAGIMVYFMFVKNDKPVSSSLQKLRDLLDFKTMLIEPILKVVYITLTIFIVLFSFGLMYFSNSFLFKQLIPSRLPIHKHRGKQIFRFLFPLLFNNPIPESLETISITSIFSDSNILCTPLSFI